jgi:hypothetical protein
LQTLPAAILGGLGNAQQIIIKVDGENFDVGLNVVEAGGANGQLLYELDPDDWNKLEESVGLKAGMILIFTRKRAPKFLLTSFSREGNLTTATHFPGATSLLPDQPGLLLTERGKNLRNTFILHVISVSDLFSDYN